MTNDVLHMIEQYPEPEWEAEVHRIRGRLMIQTKSGSICEYEQCLLQAVEVAHNQSSRMLELRAVTDLCRLWWQHGRAEEAQMILADCLGWFTEGFQTRDLQAARTLHEDITLGQATDIDDRESVYS